MYILQDELLIYFIINLVLIFFPDAFENYWPAVNFPNRKVTEVENKLNKVLNRNKIHMVNSKQFITIEYFCSYYRTNDVIDKTY